jgi:hypothetical protein
MKLLPASCASRGSGVRSAIAFPVLFCLLSPLAGPQTPASQQGSESEEVRRLNKTVADQAERLASQSKQLSDQQAAIDALQRAFAEQKALLEKLVQLNAGGAPQPKPALPPGNQPANASAVAVAKPGEEANPAAPGASVVPPDLVPTASPNLLRQQTEQPYVKTKHWFDRYSIRGYVQMRDNGIADTNSAYKCDQCDKSIGPANNLFLRRARLVLSGDVTDRISVYLQPDFASSTGGAYNFAQLRDFYFDIALDSKKEHRFRIGQSKIPFGFENMQSSSNRLDFDRSDAINSAFANERDLGVFYYYAPANIRARFNELVSSGLKGSGDFGMLGVGFFNGQILNTPEANDNFHYVARYTYPFKLQNGQFIEASIQAYTGKYTLTSLTSGVKGLPGFLYNDRRVAATLVIYPQPLGFQAEYNWGTGPRYNPESNFIDQHPLTGGYALLNYRKVLPKGVVLIPYTRFQYYDGGKKQELDARRYVIKEGDVGVEMQFGKFIELTPQFQYGNRLFEDSVKRNNDQTGALFRLQLQLNY